MLVTLHQPDRATTVRSPRAPNEVLRVLHVLPSLHGGGMEHATVRLITAWPEVAERDPHVGGVTHGLCTLRDADDALLAACHDHALTWALGPPAGEGSRRLVTAWQLRRLVRRFRPHVIHARTTAAWPDATLAARTRPRPALLLSFHGRTDLEEPPLRRRLLNRAATACADAVLTVSRDAADMMRHEWHVPGHKLTVIPNGVDTRRYRPAVVADEIRRVRSRLGLVDVDRVVICVANAYPIKALDVLLTAWRRVSMADRHARLLIVGDGPLRDAWQRRTLDLRCGATVQWLGPRSDVPELLRAADLFVLPSRYEACSNAVLEAMAAALPAIITDVGGNRELITPNRTGWLVPPDAPDPLAETVLIALHESAARRRVGAAARKCAVRRFGLDAWVRHYAELYRELAHRVRRPSSVPQGGLPCAG